MTIVGMAVLTTVTTLSSSTQALALGHWNIDEDYVPNSEFAEDGMDSSTTAEDEEESSEVASSSINSNSEEEDSSNVAYANLQACLSNLGESPTEQEVEDCVESAYDETERDESASTESNDDGDEDENGITIRSSSPNDSEDEEDEDEEDEDSEE